MDNATLTSAPRRTAGSKLNFGDGLDQPRNVYYIFEIRSRKKMGDLKVPELPMRTTFASGWTRKFKIYQIAYESRNQSEHLFALKVNALPVLVMEWNMLMELTRIRKDGTPSGIG
jgi:hypothetical protein